MWSQLSLPITLEILQLNWPTEPNITIHIGHANTSFSSKYRLGASFMACIDIKAPEFIPCAQFEKLSLHFDFQSIQKSQHTVKKPKVSAKDSSSQEMMLLDDLYGVDQNNGYLDYLKDVRNVSPCPQSIQKKSPRAGEKLKESVKRLYYQQSMLPDAIYRPRENNGHDGSFETTVEKLSRGLPISIAPCSSSIPFHDLDLDSLLLDEASEEEDMLLSETDDSANSLTSESSIYSLSSHSSQSSVSLLKRQVTDDDAGLGVYETTSKLDFSSACRLAEVAMRTLVGGRQTKESLVIQTRKRPAEVTLSRLAPAIWNPGFRDVSLPIFFDAYLIVLT